jgi:hypothetical protein
MPLFRPDKSMGIVFSPADALTCLLINCLPSGENSSSSVLLACAELKLRFTWPEQGFG